MKKTILAVAATLVFAGFSYADIARPETPKPTPKAKAERLIDTTLEIDLRDDAKDAKLLIPRSQIKQLRAQLEQMDNDGDNTAATTSGGFGRTQTIMSGIFMSLAIVLGGMWFARSGKLASKGVKTAVIAVGIGTIATAATLVYANAGPPPEARSITGKMFSQALHYYNFGSGAIKLGVSDEENRVTLIVPNPKDKNGEE
jgi:hypothetical protein